MSEEHNCETCELNGRCPIQALLNLFEGAYSIFDDRNRIEKPKVTIPQHLRDEELERELQEMLQEIRDEYDSTH